MTSKCAMFIGELLSSIVCIGLLGCGSTSSMSPPPQPIAVSISPQTATVVVANTAQLTSTVSNDASNAGVSWTVSCSASQCGTISPATTASGMPVTYTTPATMPANTSVTVTASAVADKAKSSSATLIPTGHISGYSVGVDYHATGNDLNTSAFLSTYNNPSVRQTVQMQLQGMADRGATLMHTRIWLVDGPGESNTGQVYRLGFPITDQEATNLRTYAQDVAAVQGASGNRLRLDICMLWLGAADYTMGSPATGLGYDNLSAAEYTTRVETTTDKVLAAIKDITRPDGVQLVDTLYLDGTENIGVVPNQDWFVSSQYARFVSVVSPTGIHPSIYFVLDGTEANVFDNSYIDPYDPILDGHRSVVGIYRSLKFMVGQNLPIPERIDFALYMTPVGAPYDQIFQRGLDDADATLPALGAPRLYGVAETDYLADPAQRLQYAQAYPTQAAQNSRMQMVSFWTVPSAYPFTIEDYLPLPPP